MSTEVKLAIRNLLRHKRRTFLTSLVVAAGLFVFIYMDSLFKGMDLDAVKNLINLSSANVNVSSKAYFENKDAFPLDHALKDAKHIREELQKLEAVEAITPRLSFIAELSYMEKSSASLGTIVAPETDSNVFHYQEALQGEYFSGDGFYQILLGVDLAEKLGVQIGDYITLYANTVYEARNADDFEVIGLLSTRDPNVNKSAVYINETTAKDFLELSSLASPLYIDAGPIYGVDSAISRAEALKAAIQSMFPELQVETFADAGAAFLSTSAQKKQFSYFLVGLILLIAAVGIINGVLMSVFERIKEIGVLRAMGFRPSQIQKIFLLEGFLTGLVGSLAGILAALPLVLYLKFIGIPLDKLVGEDMDTTGIPVWGTLYGELDWKSFLFALYFGLVCALLASIYPSWRASKIPVTRALKFQ